MKAAQPVIALVASRQVAPDAALGSRIFTDDIYDPGKRIRPVGKRGRPFDDFDAGHVVIVDLDTVFVTPLLAFLPDAIIKGNDAVAAESTDHRFGYGRTCCQLLHARKPGNSIDDIRGCLLANLPAAEALHRCGASSLIGSSAGPGDDDFMLFEYRLGHLKILRERGIERQGP